MHIPTYLYIFIEYDKKRKWNFCGWTSATLKKLWMNSSILYKDSYNSRGIKWIGIFLGIHHYEKDILTQFACISSANFEIYGYAYILEFKKNV